MTTHTEHKGEPMKLPTEDDFQCDTCGGAIRAGDRYTTTLDDCYLCEEHAPSFADCARFWSERTPRCDEERQAALDAQKAYRSHVEAGGSPDDKPLTVMDDMEGEP